VKRPDGLAALRIARRPETGYFCPTASPVSGRRHRQGDPPMTDPRLLARRLRSVLPVLALATGLSACESTVPPLPGCPELRIDRDTAKITMFDGAGEDLTNVLFTAQVVDVNGDCAFKVEGDGPAGTVDTRFKVLFSVTRGPALADRQGHFSYFVALPDFYPSPAAKQTLPVDFVFPEGNMTTVRIRDEEVAVAVPVKTPTQAPSVPIYVGFQLTEDQLEFNRANRR
jgi:hypothetical protein